VDHADEQHAARYRDPVTAMLLRERRGAIFRHTSGLPGYGVTVQRLSTEVRCVPAGGMVASVTGKSDSPAVEVHAVTTPLTGVPVVSCSEELQPVSIDRSGIVSCGELPT